MIIQKDINNLDRIKDKMATMPLAYEDAIEFHKRVIERVEKERKEANKAMGVGDISNDGFTGASKNPKKVSNKNLKKMHLSESLFKNVKKNFLNEAQFVPADMLLGDGSYERLSGYTDEDRETILNDHTDNQGNSLVRNAYRKNQEEDSTKKRREEKEKEDKLYKERDWEKEYELWKADGGDGKDNDFRNFLKSNQYSDHEADVIINRKAREDKWKEIQQQKSEEERANKEKEDKAKALQKYKDDKIWNSVDWIKEREDVGADNFDNFLDKYMESQRSRLENKFKAQQRTDTLSAEDNEKIQKYLDNERRVIKDRLNEFDNDEVAQDKYREKRQKEEEEKQKEFEDNVNKQIQKAKGAMKNLPGSMNRTLSNLGINLKYANRRR